MAAYDHPEQADGMVASTDSVMTRRDVWSGNRTILRTTAVDFVVFEGVNLRTGYIR